MRSNTPRSSPSAVSIMSDVSVSGMIATSSSSISTFLEADYSVLGQLLKAFGIDDNVVCTGSSTLGLAFSVLVGSQQRENIKVIDCRWGIGDGPGGYRQSS
jgi:hypothetical protein